MQEGPVCSVRMASNSSVMQDPSGTAGAVNMKGVAANVPTLAGQESPMDTICNSRDEVTSPIAKKQGAATTGSSLKDTVDSVAKLSHTNDTTTNSTDSCTNCEANQNNNTKPLCNNTNDTCSDAGVTLAQTNNSNANPVGGGSNSSPSQATNSNGATNIDNSSTQKDSSSASSNHNTTSMPNCSNQSSMLAGVHDLMSFEEPIGDSTDSLTIDTASGAAAATTNTNDCILLDLTNDDSTTDTSDFVPMAMSGLPGGGTSVSNSPMPDDILVLDSDSDTMLAHGMSAGSSHTHELLISLGDDGQHHIMDNTMASLLLGESQDTDDSTKDETDSKSGNNLKDLESLLQQAGIEDITNKDTVDLMITDDQMSDSGRHIKPMLGAIQQDSVSEDMVVVTVQADIECIPPNALASEEPVQPATIIQDSPSLSGSETKHKLPSNPTQSSSKPKSDNPSKKTKKRKELNKQKSVSYVEDLQRPRILPRTSQYEKHPLLQERTKSGMSELELFLQEKEKTLKSKREKLLKKHKSLSIDNERLEAKKHDKSRRKSVESGGNSCATRSKLLPRSTQYEIHPLLERTESGICELEIYLKEKEQEMEMKTRASAPDIRISTQRRISVGTLLPRTNQYEKHPLLQEKDDEGLSEVDKLLDNLRKDRESNDTKAVDGVNQMDSLDDPKIQPKSSIKRVHFEKAGVSEEIEELGSVQIEPDEKCGLVENTERVTEGRGQEKEPQGAKGNKKKDKQTKCCIIL